MLRQDYFRMLKRFGTTYFFEPPQFPHRSRFHLANVLSTLKEDIYTYSIKIRETNNVDLI